MKFKLTENDFREMLENATIVCQKYLGLGEFDLDELQNVSINLQKANANMRDACKTMVEKDMVTCGGTKYKGKIPAVVDREIYKINEELISAIHLILCVCHHSATIKDFKIDELDIEEYISRQINHQEQKTEINKGNITAQSINNHANDCYGEELNWNLGGCPHRKCQGQLNLYTNNGKHAVICDECLNEFILNENNEWEYMCFENFINIGLSTEVKSINEAIKLGYKDHIYIFNKSINRWEKLVNPSNHL